MSLELEEQATFRQGTDTRSEQIVVWQVVPARFQDVRPDADARFEARVSVEVPADAMHSFTSPHNAVRWKLVVRGVPERWPAFVRTFPVVVLPARAAPAAPSSASLRTAELSS
jgi:hypothetical protein